MQVWTQTLFIFFFSKDFLIAVERRCPPNFLLSEAIKKSFKKNINRVWVHTCSLDHKNALKNYLARGMKIYSKETIKI